MKKINGFGSVCAVIILIAAQFSCSMGGFTISQDGADAKPQTLEPQQGGDEQPGISPTKITIQSVPTPAIDVPAPQAGAGNVVGRILWNDQPVVGTEVKLCEDFAMFSGCKGINFSTTTDNDGYYLFSSVTPGEYALAAHAIDQNTWLFVTAGLGIGADKYTVTANKTLTIGDQSIFKFDLAQTSPGDNTEVSNAQPMLKWEAYPGADYYEVYLTPGMGGAIFVSDETHDTQITPPNALLGCEYTWQIEAFNSKGIKIAEHDGFFHFTVMNQPVSCEVTLTTPQDGASLSGQNIVLKWEGHTLAAYYRVHIWDKDYKDLLDNARSNEASYTVMQTIPAGAFTWYISAYNASDHEVARSGFYKFTVTGK